MLPFCSELCPVTCCRCCYGFKRIYTLICLIVPGFWTSVPEEKGDVLTVFVTLLTIHQHFCDVHMPFHRKDFLLYLPTKQNKLNEIFTILQLERFSKYCHGLFREKSFCRYGCNIADQYLCKKVCQSRWTPHAPYIWLQLHNYQNRTTEIRFQGDLHLKLSLVTLESAITLGVTAILLLLVPSSWTLTSTRGFLCLSLVLLTLQKLHKFLLTPVPFLIWLKHIQHNKVI